ncbi:NAD-glutamate dehydrogenase [Motiliproteus sp. MSK22-1]|uniref:NAD-glutamate dehydrogenase n=1 Tax=Motiliproteus sp. MSK22-1 TaxID=1897630 RepID=UPI0009774E52|nr:NAD-glutamate dehydrogenase [Motiliproteus sp. MSK22-1]OMH30423.1 NAD-glutamate dehydrogenase [Motiliproteus sp. MSK22-1]
MNTLVQIKQAGITQVQSLLEKRLSKNNSETAIQLAEQYYTRSLAREFAQVEMEDLYGAILCLWDLVQKRGSEQTLIRVYNPNHEDHQWHCSHTVVEVLMDDMPFIVASVNMAFSEKGISIHQVTHPVIYTERDKEGRLQRILPLAQESKTTTGKSTKAGRKANPEALIRLEIDHQPDPEAREQIKEHLHRILKDVRLAVRDWPAMKQQMQEAVDWSEANSLKLDPEVNEEALAFLRWLLSDRFLILGFRYYDLTPSEQSTAEQPLFTLNYRKGSGLGILGEPVSDSQQNIELSPYLSQLSQQPELLVLTKSTTRSTVQRPAHLDYVGVKKIDKKETVIGEWRFFGLYASNAYSTPVDEVPLLRQKIARLQERAKLPADGHSGKALRHLLLHYPRDEMLQASYEQFEETILGMLESQERRQLRLFIRPDTYGRFISVLILVPRDHYDTALRLKMQEILLNAFEGHSSEFGVRLSEHNLAQVQFTIHCHDAHQRNCDVDKLESLMSEAMASWIDRLQLALNEKLGEATGNRLLQRFAHYLPVSYRDDVTPNRAVSDLQRLAELRPGTLSTYLYRPLEDFHSLHLKVLGGGENLALSDVLPILEQMGVRVLSARPYEFNNSQGQAYWMLDFHLSVAGSFDPEDKHLKDQFQQTFTLTYQGKLENDGFNALVISAGLSWRQVVILRAICKYLLQLAIPFSQNYMEQTLGNNPHICRLLVQLFEIRFDPDYRQPRKSRCEVLSKQLEEALESVDNLDEDRILRHYLSVIQAALRTNFYQLDADQQPKGYLSIKLDSEQIPAAPLPRPRFEIFVYAPWVEGVHLRGGKVARGGLRWSDRREDFRTEVLGLVKAQLVKNSVIVPVGAKGGFVPKQLPTGSRDKVLEEVIHCYQTFIKGLLDITDNRQGEDIVPPTNVIRHDDDDPYLVVAADKGTATFSDIANQISMDYGFWLGDAFASGGANGYDHKKMGITARGAWESVKRNFRELGIDTQTQPFTVVAVGDMAGDVFGNGMLLSKQIKLVAAFNHQHIFIDPSPEPAASWTERKRLFDLPRSSWEDYDRSLISKGGGIYSRSAKSITLTDEARQALSVDARRLTPNELIHAILKAPIDLFWNGGIGTYAKASSESHEQVGDRANDSLRVNGNELGARVVGEGGNLGLTQLGRIEYARRGGIVNSDAIDNAGGVDSSDHEVNLKILLDREVVSQDLTGKQRNKLLASMTEEVASLVLRHNKLQSQILSICALQSSSRINDHVRLIHILEKEGRLKRKLEFLPTDEYMEELTRNGEGLTRPEIAVLMAYSKLRLFDHLIKDGIGEDIDLSKELDGYFPAPIREQYADKLQQHPLSREIVATHVTNLVNNRMGSTYISYLQEETHCCALDAVRAFFAAKEILSIESLWNALEELESQLDDSIFRELMVRIQDLLERTTLWLLRNHSQPLSVSELVSNYRGNVGLLLEHQLSLVSEKEQQRRRDEQQHLIDAGIKDESLAQRFAGLSRDYYCLEIVRLSRKHKQVPLSAAQTYYQLENLLGLNSLRTQIRALPDTDIWQRKARASLADELDSALARTNARLLGSTEAQMTVTDRLEQWHQEQQQVLDHFKTTREEIESIEHPNLAMLSVAVRELGQLN